MDKESGSMATGGRANKQNLQLPPLNHGQTNFRKSYNNHQSFLNLSHHKSFKRLKTKQSRAESLSQKHNTKSTQISMKAEKSMIRFYQLKQLFRKTELQKKKQKKVYSVDKNEGQQAQFFQILNHQSSKQMKQEIFQENFDQEFSMVNLPNICYDSLFFYQREGACMTILNNKLYLYGGAIRRKFYYLPQNQAYLNCDLLFHSYSDNRWVKEQVKGQLESDHRNLILHSICPINKKYLVIAGGMIGDSRQTLTKFNKSILMYNIQTKKMLEFNWNVSIRSHACISFDNFMLLYGGIDEMGKVKSDMHVISFHNGNMCSYPRIFKFQTNETLTYHQMVTTLGQDKSFRMNLRENNGIYIFGGENETGSMDNRLKLLKIYSSSELEKKGVKKFQILKTSGEGPCPRKNHSMNLVINRYALVVVGGLDVKTNFLSDVWIISLLQLKWCRIETEPSIDMFYGGICKQVTVSNSSSIFILGGHHQKEVGSENFWRLDIYSNNKKNRGKRISDISKVTSLWSVRNNDNQFGTLDQILSDE